MKLTIGHLYPDLLNLYGDRGNIICMLKRCKWRGIEAEVLEFGLSDPVDFSRLDLVLLGGGSDREQFLVRNRLEELREDFSRYVQRGGVVLAICGGYQLLGASYRMGEEEVKGLGIVDLVTERGEGRLIGNLVIECPFLDLPLVGFENHGGRTFLRSGQSLGRVLSGHGNNGEDGTEGVLYQNVFGTYLHGPLLPKNPHLCDHLLRLSLENRYGEVELSPLDDKEELAANRYIVERFCKSGNR